MRYTVCSHLTGDRPQPELAIPCTVERTRSAVMASDVVIKL